MTASKKCSRQTTRFCSGTHRVYPTLCFDFINYPILFILHPFLFTCKTRGDTETDISPQPSYGKSRTQLATCRLWCNRNSTANFPAHKDPPSLMHNLPPRFNRTAKNGGMAVSADTKPRSGARTKRQDHAETLLHLLVAPNISERRTPSAPHATMYCQHIHTVIRIYTVIRTHTVLRTHNANTYCTANTYFTANTHCEHVPTTAVLRSASIFDGLYEVRQSTPLQYTLRGKEDTLFFGKIRSSPSGTYSAESKHPKACLTRVVVRTKSPTTVVEDRHRQEHARLGKIAPQQQSLHYRYSYPYEIFETDTTTELHFVCGTADVRRREATTE